MSVISLIRSAYRPTNQIKSINLISNIYITRSISLKPDFSKFKKIEQPAGHVVGTVNDAYVAPPARFSEGGYHWAYEKIVTLSMIPTMMVPFIFGPEYPMIDYIFSVLLLFHCHAGFKSCIIDYIPQRVFGIWHKIASGVLTMGSAVSLYGIYLLETSGNGIFELVRNLFLA
ncbi:membrane anchor subunit of succinate dehydrogenase [Scheffersomyces coipomensis]|uniref:membrane anchor subunit of succinate dehydrogenase n=1 Tax=Scheffersomyces coipomensis TaxID=1788519 RepID=UPI00315D1B47